MGLVHTIGTAIQDVRHGVRVLRKSLGFAAAVVLTVALGVGATTAVFSLVYAVVLRPLPYSGPDRLVNLWSSLPSMGLARANVAAGPYRDWRAQNHVFDEMALVRSIANFNLIGEGEPERLQGARVTASLFRVLGIQPIIGRAFREDEEQIGENRVVLLSHGLWKRRFGQNPEVVGRAINLSGVPHVVIGVMPSDFHYPAREFELWTPLTIDPEEIRVRLGYDYLSVARLKRDKTLEQAQADMNAIAARLALEHPVPDTRQVGIVVSRSDQSDRISRQQRRSSQARQR
ncbi:MAG: hypothetical protein DMG14_07350 [Acidobacteria bacterium]|nr:MAG: hypothetical protein DMG14_07350 [Acidobacteriota bacterium]